MANAESNSGAALDYDYVIIGSGFGGSVSALRLAEKGYRVLVLEKGKRLGAKDFPKRNWNLKKWLWLPALRFFGFFKITYFRHVTILSGVGVGGGSLMTPLLVLLFGVSPATAVGTDLLYAAATKTGGSLVHGFARSIDWRVVRLLAAGSLPATAATLAALSNVNLDGEAARSLITFVLSIALLLTAAALVFGDSLVALYRSRVESLAPERTAGNTILVGAVLGCLVSISSVGAGALGILDRKVGQCLDGMHDSLLRPAS